MRSAWRWQTYILGIWRVLSRSGFSGGTPGGVCTRSQMDISDSAVSYPPWCGWPRASTTQSANQRAKLQSAPSSIVDVLLPKVSLNKPFEKTLTRMFVLLERKRKIARSKSTTWNVTNLILCREVALFALESLGTTWLRSHRFVPGKVVWRTLKKKKHLNRQTTELRLGRTWIWKRQKTSFFLWVLRGPKSLFETQRIFSFSKCLRLK